MRLKTFAGATLAALLLLPALATAQQSVELTIHADQPTSPVSPTLYGLMTEEINYSYEGGLYAEMVRNDTFHGDWSGINYWYLVEKGNAAAKISVDRSTGPSDALKDSLRIEMETADCRDQAGMLNVGWWGMAVKPDTEYKGSFYAKAADPDIGPVTVSLVNDHTGKTLATAKVDGIGTDWKQFTIHAEDRCN